MIMASNRNSVGETVTLPNTITDAKTARTNLKRKVTGLVKDGRALLAAGDGIPYTEFQTHAENIRQQLDSLQSHRTVPLVEVQFYDRV